ncbi:MAG TPA: hypothetical protein DCS28_00355 [Candidatus Moranbacteria bacterium]|nr:hypothetical protein [Candidatus Moranbacteria bacterium]HAT74483.1 hypothetical protein [Candidatus Moranbacteria bacterium]
MKKYIFIGIASFAVLFLSGCGTQTSTTTPTSTSTQEKKVALNTEGGTCTADANCQTGLKCVTGKCSSGKVGSVCATYKDCNTELYCVKSACSNPPSYSKYFNKIVISKMKAGMPPGPKNIPVPATEFSATTDAVEIDVQPKAGVTGDLYYELVDSTTGQTTLSSADSKMKIDPRGGGTGFGVPYGTIGNFELNVYFNGELIYTTAIKINQ